jgi:hypothetical protein
MSLGMFRAVVAEQFIVIDKCSVLVMMQVVIWENIFCYREERQSQNSETQVISET